MKMAVLTIPKEQDKIVVYDEKNQETYFIYRSESNGEDHLVLTDTDVTG